MYFNRQALRALRFIYRHHKSGVSAGELANRRGIKTNLFLVQMLFEERYVVVMVNDTDMLSVENSSAVLSHPEYKIFCTQRGEEFLERRCFDFWKWVIPTIISFCALIVSIISLCSVVRAI